MKFTPSAAWPALVAFGTTLAVVALLVAVRVQGHAFKEPGWRSVLAMTAGGDSHHGRGTERRGK
jgi:hypothetical protein